MSAVAVAATLALVSYSPLDPSFNTATTARPRNWIGFFGSYFADWLYAVFGLGALLLPALLLVVAYRWLRSRPIEAPFVRMIGGAALLTGLCTALALGPDWRLWDGVVAAGGMAGITSAGLLLHHFNLGGALLITGSALLLSLYLVSSFSMAKVYAWLAVPRAWWADKVERWTEWRAERRAAAQARREEKAELRRLKEEAREAEREAKRREKAAEEPPKKRGRAKVVEVVEQPLAVAALAPPIVEDRLPWEEQETEAAADDIPIRLLEEIEPKRTAEPMPEFAAAAPIHHDAVEPRRRRGKPSFVLPSTTLLIEQAPRNAFDEQELKETASRIKSKFEEFNVLGNVVQINPGPVVTTYEFKPEAGIKYSRITTLMEDLCLGLQAESILIERIPGKPTVGIEVPNTKREVIALRALIESDEFRDSASRMTIGVGKDINGRMKVAALETMPHLLIAGSTGSGKSVMLNTLIMSILFKSTPDEVRMIMIDPKRLELGLYEGIPHLLTPVITDPKKATNALRNAVLEMERRLKLLAAQGVRNIDQYNKKVRQILTQPRNLFDDEGGGSPPEEDLAPIPYVLIIIDELADLMMLERANVEESVTRLAQMARAVGMHLVLATQRPSVDVITGLIKANFPARMSFRVATRVDSRTILDVMGAEHLLGRGDMLFLPPGSSRLVRVHGSFVTETETAKVVDFWKAQGTPEYDQSYLIAPPSEDSEDGDVAEFDGEQDPMYQDAVRVVLELGKASTSVLQRRLRLGYGRAARILDMMHREGIIGPVDGSRPREVLKSPDWLNEVEAQLR